MGGSWYLWSEEADFEVKRQFKKHHENLENIKYGKSGKYGKV